MSNFKVGDRVRYTPRNQYSYKNWDGWTGTVEAAPEHEHVPDDMVRVRWDAEFDSVDAHNPFKENLDLIDTDEPKQEGNFLREWATKLEEFADSNTRVAPYSYIGFVAELINDYRSRS